ncbi:MULTISPECIES: AfsR/SARP family transcriptional regulator [unclassified Streptomyces]|uniref:AfsR/SARP family transcriptional regulator n=1 Tax=unclassified Streptomyces TaxID=2593676 RepID=UPI001BEA585A|nr:MULTISPECIES: AfsR/SARP family transcriptional regulator [unclassified Streptomyces]MBT2406460.1 AfsR/SARP family transcriptional regulator [Streptomyces sp. ISL-21]MBT2612466.1 AfsR/SARP family transcriptional regulator [Streptomyces sp. ISL-87]
MRALLEPGRVVRGRDQDRDRLLVSDGDGYALRVPAESVDAIVFKRQVTAGRELSERGETGPAHDLLTRALELWGGEPLAGVPGPDAERQRERLCGLRRQAQERLVACELALGRHNAVVPDLVALVQESPLDERLRAHLMLALHRCGRLAEALEVYADTRTLLAGELGVPPGRELTLLRDRLRAASHTEPRDAHTLGLRGVQGARTAAAAPMAGARRPDHAAGALLSRLPRVSPPRRR